MSSSKPNSTGSGAGPRQLKTEGPKSGTGKKSSSTVSALRTKESIDAASAADIAAAERNASLTTQAQENAYSMLHTPYNPDDDVDEDVDEETIKAQMADLLKEEEPQPRPLTLELIRQRALPPEVLQSGNQDLISKKLFSLERMYLDVLSLSTLDDSFDLFTKSLTHLYLQRNLLTNTHGLEVLKELQFLMLAQNRIRSLEGLNKLEKLVFLDVSDNLIEVLDTGSAEDEEDDGEDTCQLPASLVAFNCKGNPFTQEGGEEYIQHIVTVSPYLKTLDGRRITQRMRREFGLEASDDDDDEEQSASAASASMPASARGGDDDDDEDEADAATEALRKETEEMRKRSQQRTMLYDTKHFVSQSQTDQDRQEALAAMQIQEAEERAARK